MVTPPNSEEIICPNNTNCCNVDTFVFMMSRVCREWSNDDFYRINDGLTVYVFPVDRGRVARFIQEGVPKDL